VEAALREILASAYGLEAPVLHRLPAGDRPVFTVACGSGAFVLKLYPEEAEPLAALLRSAAGAARAAAGGVPTPEIVADHLGRTAVPGPRFRLVLCVRAPGRHHRGGGFPEPAAADLGRTIARLQRALAGWEPAGLRPDHDWPLEPADGLRRLETLLRAAEERADPPGRRTAAALRSRLEALSALEGQLGGLAALPRQWVHGDCNPGNFLFEPAGRVAAVLDFDNLSRLPRGFDFMYALDQAFREPGPPARAALRAYIAELRPPRAEVEAYPRLWVYCALQNIVETTYGFRDRDGGAHEARVAEPAPAWWLAHWPEVTDFFLRTADAREA
jgi:Ser/Thr protein kinase RdoA (MazF antagonist)